jgi:hypothetical protein
MSDGSYDEKRAFDVSFCMAMTRCELTGYTALVIWAERSFKFSTDNYQAEILGAIALQLLIKTAWGNNISELLWTDSSTFLKEDKYPLDLDFAAIDKALSDTWQARLLEIGAAPCAANFVETDLLDDEPTDYLPVQIETEGSIRFRHRCRCRSGVIEHMPSSIPQLEEVNLFPYDPGCCSVCVDKNGCCCL